MRWLFASALAATLLLWAYAPLADPASNSWGCDARGLWCVIAPTSNSEIIVLREGPWQFCLDPFIGGAEPPAVGAEVQLWKVDGVLDVEEQSHIVLGLTLDGDEPAGLRCIYMLGAGRYWMEAVVTSANAIATLRHM